MPEALIWGASGGIGSALVRTLKSTGWRVHAAARDEMRIPEEADCAYAFDAADPQSFEQVALFVAQEAADGLDLVIYAAGAVNGGKLDTLDGNEWTQNITANLTGAHLAARTSLDLLSKDGHLMFIGAYVDKITLPKMGGYAAAKAGLETMVAVLRKENRRRNITMVRPPAVDTDFWDNVPFSKPDGAISPESVASAIMEAISAGESGELDL